MDNPTGKMRPVRIKFEEMRSPEIGRLVEKGATILLPIGAVEEHSRHLPVSTDTTIAYAAALAAAGRVAGRIPVAVLPPVWFGYSVALLKNWPGTITIRPKVLIDYLYEMCRSLIDMGFTKILIVNGHGNNPGVLDVMARTVGDDFKVFPGVVNTYGLADPAVIRRERKSKAGGIGHACELETSLMLYLTDLTDMSRAGRTDIMKSTLRHCPVDTYAGGRKDLYLSTWYLENSTHGGAGDPTVATKAFGETIFNSIVAALADVIGEFHGTQVALAKRKLKRKCRRF